MKKLIRFFGALVGAVTFFSAGVLFGLLFSQKPGRKLRSELSRSSRPMETLWNELKLVGSSSIESVKEWKDEGLGTVKEMLDEGKERLEMFVEKVKDLSEDAKEEAKEALERLANEALEASEKIKHEGQKLESGFKRDIRTIAKRIRR